MDSCKQLLNMLSERLSLMVFIMGLKGKNGQNKGFKMTYGVIMLIIFLCLGFGGVFYDKKGSKMILLKKWAKNVRNEGFYRGKGKRTMVFMGFLVFCYIFLLYNVAMCFSGLRTIIMVFPYNIIRMIVNGDSKRIFIYKRNFLFLLFFLVLIDFLKSLRLRVIFGYFFVGLIWILSFYIDIPMNSNSFLFSSLYCIPIVLIEFFMGIDGSRYSISTFFLVIFSSMVHIILRFVKTFDSIYMIKFFWPFSTVMMVFMNYVFFGEYPGLIDLLSLFLMYYCFYKSLNSPESYIKYHSKDDVIGIRRVKTYLTLIMKNHDSRNIFLFFFLNLTFMFIQLGYGIFSNSLGLISDSIHMAFDCFALLVGLLASIISKFPPSFTFPFGFSRIEVLSGFVNGLLLLLLSISIVIEAVSRLLTPKEIHLGKLLPVSIIGFIINLFGIFLFRHGHNHNHNHNLDGIYFLEKKHESNDSIHNHFSNNYIDDIHNNVNIYGVFLHIFADTLGSFGVIVSTLLIHRFKWPGFDSLASILIAVLIFASSIPLILSSAKNLLLIVPHDFEYNVYNALNKIKTHSGILCLENYRFWMNNENTSSGIIRVSVKNDQDLNIIRQEIEKVLKESIKGLVNVTVVTERR
ncbi:hypothetical protein T552_02890 [Pneumocystis carinii B80]|uniref:Zinc transporter n=1 Tax=Pneumocystis carinii (strain B80) TaxID=1408658 RepID=A0A0W4ZDE1_PNEC8|nr:hypothetical protein T552_02890 [Pneumocystis carinii B80]KTW26409.1 hypothetical protein T552_02890 [Pneumocystis carinii B80]